ncbi:MAG TPA: glycosyltransferase [Candidatus Nanoarchaeia archaeon]|nr:glycosyltransferase [Candidatus Nanoarchaeia archaeon]
MKLSFLMAAHNEERIIRNALENLASLPFKEYEVLLGLDGCTDGTLKIVEEFERLHPKVFSHLELNERKGKPAVINKLYPRAKGEIIVIHDADWVFRVQDQKSLQEVVSWFDDPKLGGIVESYPVEYDEDLLKKAGDWAFLASAYGNYFWLEFMKERFTVRKNNDLYVNPNSKNFPFLCNVFRKELYKANETLADDFERPLDILERGFLLRVLNNPEQPRMVASYAYQSFADLGKQKTRTALAREQLFKKYNLKVTLTNFYLPLVWFMMTRSWLKKRLKVVVATRLWILFTLYGALRNRLVKKERGTREGWLLRAERR